MKTILLFATLFLVVWLTLGSNEKQKDNEEEDFEEIVDREKTDAMPKPGCMHFLCFSHVK